MSSRRQGALWGRFRKQMGCTIFCENMTTFELEDGQDDLRGGGTGGKQRMDNGGFPETHLVSWVSGGLEPKGSCHFPLTSRFTFGVCHPCPSSWKKGWTY